MPALSWTEIRQCTIQFSRDWKSESEEQVEAQNFWNEFFSIFGMRRRQVGQTVLDVRQKFLDAGNTLADLYDPLYMHAELLKAHQTLDIVVDKAYRSGKFHCERSGWSFFLNRMGS